MPMLATDDDYTRHARLTLIHQDFLAPGRMQRGIILTAVLRSKISLSARLIVLVLSVQVEFLRNYLTWKLINRFFASKRLHRIKN
jgi:hypothetical protein